MLRTVEPLTQGEDMIPFAKLVFLDCSASNKLEAKNSEGALWQWTIHDVTEIAVQLDRPPPPQKATAETPTMSRRYNHHAIQQKERESVKNRIMITCATGRYGYQEILFKLSTDQN